MDPVRFLSNASSGALGLALAATLKSDGANVILVLGPTHLSLPSSFKTIRVVTALEMRTQVQKYLPKSDVFISSAAVGDWRFEKTSHEKLKKGALKKMQVTLVRNPDILAEAGSWKKKHNPSLVLVGFGLETSNGIKAGQKKLQEKNLDLIVVNSPKTFSSNHIQSTWIEHPRTIKKESVMTKRQFSKKMSRWIETHGH